MRRSRVSIDYRLHEPLPYEPPGIYRYDIVTIRVSMGLVGAGECACYVTDDGQEFSAELVLHEGVLDALARAGFVILTPEAIDGAVSRISGMTGDDPERDHGIADDILLALVPRDVKDAYEALVERAAWWGAA